MADENVGTDAGLDVSSASSQDTSAQDNASQALEHSDTGSNGAADKGWFETLDPKVPPSANWWSEKGYNAVKAMYGRAQAAQRTQGQQSQAGTQEQQENFSLAQQILEIPGIYDIALALLKNDSGGVDQWYQRFSGGNGNGNGQRQSAQQATQQDLLAMTPSQFQQWLSQNQQQAIQQALQNYDQQRVGPLSQQFATREQESALRELRSTYPDVSRYEETIVSLMNEGVPSQRAYYIAKGEAGGFGRPKANAQQAFSEGAGPRSGGSEPDESEMIKRSIRQAGPSSSPL